MYCYKCGKQIDDEAIICPACGVPTQNFAKQSTPAATAPPPVTIMNSPSSSSSASSSSSSSAGS
ncbi:MAG: zinc-ribbon domain-containing protein [Clostridiales bacterium]|nr:zinc-ribbon domain-containing protein [Clostridiales bacterium]